MKRFAFLIFSFAFLAIATCSAQYKLLKDQFYYAPTALAGDTVGSVVTEWNKAIRLNKSEHVYYTAEIVLADLTAGAQDTVRFQGKVLASDAYTTITTVIWYGGGVDTTIRFQNISTKVAYNYLNTKVTRRAATTKVNSYKVAIAK